MGGYIRKKGECRGIRRAKLAQIERERRHADDERRRRASASCMTILAMLTVLLCCMGASDMGRHSRRIAEQADCAFTTAVAYEPLLLADDDVGSMVDARCRSAFDWPIHPAAIDREFRRPATTWSAGHRGVDLRTEQMTSLLAPADGVVSFVGKVGGKDVVSIRHGALVSTFEPATTDLPQGARVTRGDEFGKVVGVSDHCADACVHWGIKRGADDYLDPAAQVRPSRIALKPATGKTGR